MEIVVIIMGFLILFLFMGLSVLTSKNVAMRLELDSLKIDLSEVSRSNVKKWDWIKEFADRLDGLCSFIYDDGGLAEILGEHRKRIDNTPTFDSLKALEARVLSSLETASKSSAEISVLTLETVSRCLAALAHAGRVGLEDEAETPSLMSGILEVCQNAKDKRA
jgi:hypothetical protein